MVVWHIRLLQALCPKPLHFRIIRVPVFRNGIVMFLKEFLCLFIFLQNMFSFRFDVDRQLMIDGGNFKSALQI